MARSARLGVLGFSCVRRSWPKLKQMETQWLREKGNTPIINVVTYLLCWFLVGWLVGWLAGWLAGWLVGGLVGWCVVGV